MLDVIYKLLVALGSSLLLSTAFAATPISTIHVPITGDQPEQVTPLLAEGLSKVMVRLTGNPQVTQQPAVTDLLKDPNVFLERYTQQEAPASLKIEFDQQAIAQALNKLGIATWTDKRPTIMVWWLTTDQQTSSLLGDSQPTSDVIAQAATQQGFATRLPLADLDEQGLTDKATFNADKPTAIFKASEKYNPNAILAVSATQLAADKWQLSWRLWQANNTALLANGQLEGDTLASVTDHLFAAINPPLAKVYVVKAGETKQLVVTIKNVDFSSYVQINNLMTTFNGRPLENSGSVVRYEVTAAPAQLSAQLELIHLYQQPADPASTNPNELVFSPQ